MTLAFSSSSPIVSVALFDEDGALLSAREAEGHKKASGTLLDLLDDLLAEAGVELDSVSLFAADLGPGSFTGVKVAVTMCKTFAYAQDRPVCGATAFDLIDPSALVAVPSKKSEYFLRAPGEEPETTSEPLISAIGYGRWFKSPKYPSAARFERLLDSCERCEPAALVPYYVAEPSISTPKNPRLMGHTNDR